MQISSLLMFYDFWVEFNRLFCFNIHSVLAYKLYHSLHSRIQTMHLIDIQTSPLHINTGVKFKRLSSGSK